MIVVSGAGPVGLFVSYLLASKGFEVRVYEKNKKSFGRACGGLVSTDFLNIFPQAREAVLNVVHGAVINFYGKEFEISKKGVAIVLDNAKFEEILFECARSEGADVFYTSEAIPGELNIIAEGCLSKTRKKIVGNTPKYVMGAQYLCKGEFDDHVRLLFREEIPFFGWLIPLDEKKAKVGVGIKSGNSLPYLEKVAKTFSASPIGPIEARPIPIDIPMRKVVRGSYVFIGDSVPHVKATTGGGLYYGFSAAEALAHGLREYELWHTRYAYPRLLFHYAVRKALERMREIHISQEISIFGDMNDPSFLFKKELVPLTFRNAFLALRTLL